MNYHDPLMRTHEPEEDVAPAWLARGAVWLLELVAAAVVALLLVGYLLSR